MWILVGAGQFGSFFSSDTVFALFRLLYIRSFVVISYGKTVGVSGMPTMQDVEKHCQRRAVGRAVVRCSERQWSHLSAYDEQARRENVQGLGQIQTDAHADAQNVT